MQACSDVEEVVVFFYNPNIHPRKEYEIRKEENKEYCKRIGVEFVDCDYDVQNWYARMKGEFFYVQLQNILQSVGFIKCYFLYSAE